MEQIPHADLLDRVRALVDASAVERVGWIRENLRSVMVLSGRDTASISALSGVSAATVRGFLGGTDSSVSNVLRMAVSLGVSLADLERSPGEFATLLESRKAAARP